jgi:hypothetical protein
MGQLWLILVMWWCRESAELAEVEAQLVSVDWIESLLYMKVFLIQPVEAFVTTENWSFDSGDHLDMYDVTLEFYLWIWHRWELPVLHRFVCYDIICGWDSVAESGG